MKRLFVIILILFWASCSWAVGKDGFVVNVMRETEVIKEVSGVAILPFYSEYKIKLKNMNNRRAVGKVTIDGIQISNLGDFVVPSNGEILLERFLDQSLIEGKKFKFVPLTHPEVDDPYSKENGRIRVEFRLEKDVRPYPILLNDGGLSERTLSTWEDGVTFSDSTATNTLTTTGSLSGMDSVSMNFSATSAFSGATIGGSRSDQRFREIHFEKEDRVVLLELKMMGI